jgi:hypothetical protein
MTLPLMARLDKVAEVGHGTHHQQRRWGARRTRAGSTVHLPRGRARRAADGPRNVRGVLGAAPSGGAADAVGTAAGAQGDAAPAHEGEPAAREHGGRLAELVQRLLQAAPGRSGPAVPAGPASAEPGSGTPSIGLGRFSPPLSIHCATTPYIHTHIWYLYF